MAKAPTSSTEKTRRVPKIVVSAPGGPRRRAGYGFGPAETSFTEEQLGEAGETLIEAWRADPLLKVDVRIDEESEQETGNNDSQ
ncbi:hypothetical protein AM571_CH03311 [Rhizobium etli 8C-3]|uniref:Mu-like prophage FluMu N-terminal domain-containing protein n=1 Tax=Rhizobium etli 8C-3 TaxID=538025 RepID=A0A1L5P7I3_RHIET|nr:hypothetical protein [Rhizobium etli]APO76105.1 hypothetical protein AM571_CH03311 [Rhizobium etli 8C-3]